ncbi:hypothetical protein BTJ68_14315 [Hortaea werneckii EXF-2000]|uniref:isopentenyl-diphosphate Delta-isomerase n=2 Tax=Hortaea werneckii TaxID=91943 RepID=A0A1Z5SPJ6_HORWE|nr:hypothetical protein BTJ68_14315 [Hortaea werneckii EXF-2000]
MSATQTATIAPTQPSNAAEILRMFPEINTHLATQTQTHTTNGNDSDLAGYDEEQIRLMDEVCIVLDENDLPIGSASKKICHLMENIDKGLLHRAFSCFLFDKDNKLLLQQRASEKITFPDMWTNTCCSHPLGVPGETGSTLEASILGAKRAAQRKLQQELGIKPAQVPLEKFQFLTRIHYKAPSDGKWGEHEIDYILFIKADVDLDINPNEVQATQYVSEGELKEMFKDDKLKFTPWFKLICQTMMFEWWEHLNGGLEKYMNEPEIRRMTYRCPTTNGTTGQGREAQAHDDSVPRSRSNSEDRQAQVSLTTIRERMKSSKLEHKIVKHERSRRIFPSKEKSRIGDGFEKTELRVEHRIVSHRKRKPWRREPIVYKPLSLAGGPLPDVMFECSADELNVEQSGGLHHITARLPSSSRQADPTDQLTTADEQAQNPLREEARVKVDHDNCASRGLRTSGPTEKTIFEPNHLRKRRVSFSDRDRFINAQLSSVKAPPRPQATSDDDDAEDSEEEEADDDDDEVGSGRSEDERQGAPQNVDATKGIDDELLADYSDHTFIPQRSAPLEQPTLQYKSSSIGREDAVDSSDDENLEGRIEAPGYFRRRSIERMRLLEADEPIDEFLDQSHAERMSTAVSGQYSGSTEEYMSRKILIKSGVLEEGTDCMTGQPRRPRLRSILKSNTPLMPEVTYRPDDLEGNTRRNSRHAVNVEDSRYFSQASEILRDPDGSNHKVLPRRKRSTYFDREDEKQVEGHHDGPLHGPRQDAELLRNPQSSPRPERDLKTLTRQVSRANGTMSQSVRRRPTFSFESPFKIPPIR